MKERIIKIPYTGIIYFKDSNSIQEVSGTFKSTLVYDLQENLIDLANSTQKQEVLSNKDSIEV